VTDSGRHILSPGKEIDLTIESVAFGGDGVARYENYVIFVPDVIPGEVVRVRVTETKASFGRAVPVAVVQPSPDRVEPPCAIYGVCGGCQYQHVSYPRCLELKEEQVKDVLQRIGGLAAGDISAGIVPSPEAYGYRSAVSLRVRKHGGPREAGYVARDNKTFVPVGNCPIASEAINQSLSNIGPVLEGFAHQAKIRALIIKSSGAETLHHPIYHGPFRYETGDRLSFHLGRIVLAYGALTFFQVNHAMIPGLVDLVEGSLAPRPDETLFDLYAGVGLFSLALAARYRRVFGIEMGEEAVACFETNVRENHVANVTVVRGKVEANLEALRTEIEESRSSVVVDPPREGLAGEVVRFLVNVPVRRLVYVSCDPATLARDLKRLAGTYDLLAITPLDMFPQTRHIEAVAVLEPAPPAKARHLGPNELSAKPGAT
jgi:tRNA/tmRNA/rRNA uracil-C5-methylase (TrmA/RlmC/RlmD family)